MMTTTTMIMMTMMINDDDYYVDDWWWWRWWLMMMMMATTTMMMMRMMMMNAISFSGKSLCCLDPYMAKRLTTTRFLTYDEWDLKLWNVCSCLQHNSKAEKSWLWSEVKRNETKRGNKLILGVKQRYLSKTSESMARTKHVTAVIARWEQFILINLTHRSKFMLCFW